MIAEALARCGEVKYGAVESMASLAKCVGGIVRNVIGKANEVEVSAAQSSPCHRPQLERSDAREI